MRVEMQVVMAVVVIEITPGQKDGDRRYSEGCSDGAVAPELTVNTKQWAPAPVAVSLNPK